MFIAESVPDSSEAHLWAKELSRSYGASDSFLNSTSNINIPPLCGFQSSHFKDEFVLRLGLRYVKGLSEVSGKAIVRERMKRPFVSIDDLHHRVPELRKDELRKLAAVGAFNFIQESPKSNVQRPMSKTKDDELTLDIGRWTLDK